MNLLFCLTDLQWDPWESVALMSSQPRGPVWVFSWITTINGLSWEWVFSTIAIISGFSNSWHCSENSSCLLMVFLQKIYFCVFRHLLVEIHMGQQCHGACWRGSLKRFCATRKGSKNSFHCIIWLQVFFKMWTQWVNDSEGTLTLIGIQVFTVSLQSSLKSQHCQLSQTVLQLLHHIMWLKMLILRIPSC